MFSDFEDLVKKNRSCRGYDSNYKVSIDELMAMVNCARLTASSRSIQPLKYKLVVSEGAYDACPNGVVIGGAVHDDAVTAAGEHTTTEACTGAVLAADTQVAICNRNIKLAGALPELNLPYPGTAPNAFIIVCQDTAIDDNPTTFLKDVGIAAQTILLKATEMGLAGCMIGNFNREKLPTELGIPSQYRVLLVISIGKSIEDIRMIDINEDESPVYYRRDGVHYVPKRKLEDVLI